MDVFVLLLGLAVMFSAGFAFGSFWRGGKEDRAAQHRAP